MILHFLRPVLLLSPSQASTNGFSFASRLMKFYDSKDIKLSEVAHIAIDEAIVPSNPSMYFPWEGQDSQEIW